MFDTMEIKSSTGLYEVEFDQTQFTKLESFLGLVLTF